MASITPLSASLVKEATDISATYKAVAKSASQRLTKELLYYQDKLSDNEVKALSRHALIFHVVAL